MIRPRRVLDVLGVGLAFLFSTPTLGYPVSRDHALFYYIGRGWLHGALPYRDAYDFKPPGIFALNALGIAIFGEHQWAIRLLEVLSLPLMAWLVVLAVERDEPRRDGELGAVTLIIAGFYYTLFNYWDTAQTEFFESLALVASFVVAVRVQRVRHAALWSGALVGAAILFKFPAPVVGIISTCVVATRAYRSAPSRPVLEGAIATGLHGVGAILVLAVVVVYFALRGGLSAMVDMLFWHLWDYHAHSTSLPGEMAESLKGYFASSPWHPVVLAGFVAAVLAARRRGARGVVRGALVATTLFGASVGTVVVQRRYLPYYWGVTVPFVGLLAAYGVASLARVRGYLALTAALAASILGFSVTPRWPLSYKAATARFYRYGRGELSRWEYLEPFRGPFDYSYRDEEALGTLIRERASPGDLLHVRGYEPAVYVVSGLRSPSRFATEIPLFLPNLTYKRAEWRAENDRAIWAARPRFFVTFSFNPDDMLAIVGHGYHEQARQGPLVLLERD